MLYCTTLEHIELNQCEYMQQQKTWQKECIQIAKLGSEQNLC